VSVRRLVVLVLACGCATLRPAAPPVPDVAGTYCGRFYWTTDEVCYSAVRLTVATHAVSGRRITFTGAHHYEAPEGRFRMRVEGEVDTGTRRVVIHESEPSAREKTVVDGAFEGRMTPDLRTIAAIWTTRGTGEVGVLVLHAEGTPGAECPDVVLP
jgi:hypothetical protein